MSDPTTLNTNAAGSGLRVELRQSSIRQTSTSANFGEVLGEGLSRSLEVAGPLLPGGGAAVVAAAVQGVRGFRSAASVSGQTSTIGLANSASPNAGSFGGAGSTTSSGVGGGANAPAVTPGDQIERMQEYAVANQSMQFQFLSLQQQMQAENQKISSISNIMKTRHDTVKNSISNIR